MNGPATFCCTEVNIDKLFGLENTQSPDDACAGESIQLLRRSKPQVTTTSPIQSLWQLSRKMIRLIIVPPMRMISFDRCFVTHLDGFMMQRILPGMLFSVYQRYQIGVRVRYETRPSTKPRSSKCLPISLHSLLSPMM